MRKQGIPMKTINLQSNRNRLIILLMIAGIVVLILTPFIRIIVSVVYFGREKNWKYVFITLFVLLVITLSLTLH